MDKILANAVASIQLAIEDYHSDGKNRSLSALRNISAGVLLLFKAKLAGMAPDEGLIKKNLKLAWENGQIRLEPSGDNTIDFEGVKDRFKLVKLKFDFGQVQHILKLRNRVEHYAADISHAAMREAIATAAIVIGDFCREHLGEEAASLIGPELWQSMLEVQEINAAEIASCQARKKEIKWANPELQEIMAEHHSCLHCDSKLTAPINLSAPTENLLFSCVACGHIEAYQEAVERAFLEWSETESIAAVMDGGDDVWEECGQCSEEFVIASCGYCVRCGYSKFTSCPTCRQVFVKGAYCEYCDAMAGSGQ
ncbi:hypothetical protein [Achromobacter anxifer]|uniref:hypothetical protein n=1 Tax=Achromobacter anxifer TaxID=1287737 RepID=UPI0023F61A01|nr:hypothetical protein [Achromobacter anxifer]MDF8365310.1 hypothetical protein [Achromobacter anxifer]